MALDLIVLQTSGRRIDFFFLREPTMPSNAQSYFETEDEDVALGVDLFVVALIAAVLGFTGTAFAAAGVAKMLFFIFIVLFFLSLLGHLARRNY